MIAIRSPNSKKAEFRNLLIDSFFIGTAAWLHDATAVANPTFMGALLIALAGFASAWTHRDADDPGIALMEGAAILGDILTFYQEHYANEAYLRTAAWRERLSDGQAMVSVSLVDMDRSHTSDSRTTRRKSFSD